MAKDLSHLSDAELDKIIKSGPPVQNKDLSKVSDDELDKIISSYGPEKPSNAGKAALEGYGQGLTMGYLPQIQGGLEKPITAGLNAVASTGLGSKLLGVPQNPNVEADSYLQSRDYFNKRSQDLAQENPKAFMAGQIGGGLNSAIITPGLGAAKGLGTAGKIAAGGGAGGLLAGIQNPGDVQGVLDPLQAQSRIENAGIGAVTGGGLTALGIGASKLYQGAKSLAPKVNDLGKKAFSKVASALTGETDQNIKTFIDKNAEINALIKNSGGDIPEAADQVRQKMTKDIQSFKTEMGKKIGQALDSVSPEKAVPAGDIILPLEQAKQKINANLRPEEIQALDDIITKLQKVSGKENSFSLKELNDVKEYLQEMAKPSYMKGGQIFTPGKDFQQAAKLAARDARQLLNEAVPELANANNKLTQLHNLEDQMNRNLIASGKPESALIAAGSGNGRNTKGLQRMGQLIGSDLVGEAQKLASTKAFANPNLLPMSAGGTTSTSRTLLSSGVGAALGGPAGAVISTALSSPMALKQAINAGVVTKNAIESVLRKPLALTDQGLSIALQQLQKPENIDLLSRSIIINTPINRRMNQIKGGQNGR